MTKLSVIGVDSAENVNQVAMLSHAKRELCNRASNRRKFAEYLARQRPRPENRPRFSVSISTSRLNRIIAKKRYTPETIIRKSAAADRRLWMDRGMVPSISLHSAVA